MMQEQMIEIPSEVHALHSRCFALELDEGAVFVDPADMPRANAEDIGAIKAGREIYVGRFFRIMGQMVILFDNRKQPSVTLPEKYCKILGRVVHKEKTPCAAGNRQDVSALVG